MMVFLLPKRDFLTIKRDIQISKKNLGSLNDTILELKQNHILIDSDLEDEEYWNYIRSQLHIGEIKLSLFYIMTSTSCNFECNYCYMIKNKTKEDSKIKQFPSTSVDSLVNFFSKLPLEENITIIFYGGEPLLNFNFIKKFISKIKSKLTRVKFRFQIVTNGAKITGPIAKYFKDNKFIVSVSLDGEKTVNDFWRKTYFGSPYDLAIKGIENLVKSKVNFGISFTITPQNYQSLKYNVEHILSKYDIKSLGFNPWLDFQGVDQYHLDLNKQNSALCEVYTYLNSKNIYEDRVNRKVESFTKQKLKTSDCGAIGNQLVFFPNGNIGICHAFQNKYILGNINKSDSSILFSPEMKLWANRSPFNMELCKYCVAISVCGGGCPHNAFVKHNSIYGLDDNFCFHSKFILDWLLDLSYNNMLGETDANKKNN